MVIKMTQYVNGTSKITNIVGIVANRAGLIQLMSTNSAQPKEYCIVNIKLTSSRRVDYNNPQAGREYPDEWIRIKLWESDARRFVSHAHNGMYVNLESDVQEYFVANHGQHNEHVMVTYVVKSFQLVGRRLSKAEAAWLSQMPAKPQNMSQPQVMGTAPVAAPIQAQAASIGADSLNDDIPF